MRGGNRLQASLVGDGGHVQKNLEEVVIHLGREALLGDWSSTELTTSTKALVPGMIRCVRSSTLCKAPMYMYILIKTSLQKLRIKDGKGNTYEGSFQPIITKQHCYIVLMSKHIHYTNYQIKKKTLQKMH